MLGLYSASDSQFNLRYVMDIAQAIREARGGKSQQVFATEIGASISTLQRWESGESTPAHYQHVVNLIRFGVPRGLLTGSSGTTVAV